MSKSKQEQATTGQVNKWDAILANDAAEASSIEDGVSSGRFISTKGGVLSFGGAEFPDNKMNVIILDHILENHLYDQRFDPNNPASPICFAFGRADDTMSPHTASAQPQCDHCKDCQFNQWGTADVGKGKACKNIRRFALLSEDALEDIDSAEVAFFKIPVTSVKAWATYVKALKKKFNRPPYAVMTEVALVDDDKDTFHVTFKLVELIEDPAVLEAIYTKRQGMEEELSIPYEPTPEAPPARNNKLQRPGAARPVVPAKGRK